MSRMARLAWFSPMPPARSGVALYSTEIVAALRATHRVQVFTDEPLAAAARASGIPPEFIRSAHDFVWLNQREPYDLTVYQLGNSSAHDFAWPYLGLYPGLVVLHDVHLHHARAAALLRQNRADDYRAEFAASDPEGAGDLAELAVRGFDSFLHYDRPMTRLVVDASRVTAVHSPLAAAALAEAHPDATIERIRLGHGTLISEADRREARTRIRAQHGIPADAVVFGVFGGLSPEKRIPQILAALEATRAYTPAAHLLLIGAAAEHYDVSGDVRRRQLDSATTITGYVDDETFTAYLAACDVSLNLRWPSAREVSGPWVRALAAGCSTVTMDLWHTADVPGLDPRSWTVIHAAETLTTPEPVTVKIDILDEDHSLRLAMRRLAVDPALRERLARAGVAWWQAEHAHEAMLADYEGVIGRALNLRRASGHAGPTFRSGVPADSRLRSLLEPFEIAGNLWSRI
jgi:glycosyltransferase involved in cell wall biosynthesis